METKSNYLQDQNEKDGRISGINYNKSPYYESSLKIGLEFQDYVACELAKIGISILNFSSEKYQLEKGENLQGYEIKKDQKFRKTGNLWIELFGKSKPENKKWIKEGINRSDNTKFYIIGDEKGIYLCQKKILKIISKPYKEIENNKHTSIGFLFPVEKADLYFDYYKLPIL